MTLAEAGMLAKCGLNSEGIGVAANILGTERDYLGEGVPYHILLRGVLESKSMAYALRAAVNHPRVSSGNFLIADAGGEAIDLEAFPGDFGYLLPRDGVIVHANHFESAFSTQIVDQFKARAALTLLRPERARHLLRTAIKNERVDVDGMKAVFRDHYSYPNSICRHVDPHDHPDHANCTAFSVVIDLNERIFQIAKGQPCEHEYETINLADLY